MAKFDDPLFACGFATGSTHYDDHYPREEQQNRIVLTLEPENRNDSPTKMIVDTGAPWCVLNPDLAEAWDIISASEGAPITSLTIRGENRTGRLLRANLTLQATNGTDLTVDATFFVPFMAPEEEWLYPNFLGLNGFLDRIRYAVDATENAFYFGGFAASQ